jgi:hypothetical protein
MLNPFLAPLEKLSGSTLHVSDLNILPLTNLGKVSTAGPQ